MYLPLRLGLRLQDMFLLLALGVVFVGVAYLVDILKDQLKGASYDRTNFSPWSTPQFYLLLVAAGVGLLSVFSWPEYTFDLQLHATYLIVSAPHAGTLFALYFSLLAFCYFSARRLPLLPGITLLHLVLTFGGLLFMIYGQGLPETLMSAKPFALVRRQEMVALALLITAFAQFLFPLNLLIGYIRKQRS